MYKLSNYNKNDDLLVMVMSIVKSFIYTLVHQMVNQMLK